MTALRLLGVLLVLGLAAPVGWVATALPALAEGEGGDAEGGDSDSDEAADEEDEETVRARQATPAQAPATQATPAQAPATQAPTGTQPAGLGGAMR